MDEIKEAFLKMQAQDKYEFAKFVNKHMESVQELNLKIFNELINNE